MKLGAGRDARMRRGVGVVLAVVLAGACGHLDGTFENSDVESGRDAAAVSPQGASSDPAVGPLNAALVGLPEQRWVRILPEPSRRYIPRSFRSSEALEDDPNPQGRDYSGVIYAEGMLVYFGGGHAGYMGNDVEVYDIRRNVWTQSYKPDVAPENSPDPTWTKRLAPMGRPWVEHTYQVGCYDPANRSVLWLLQYGGMMRWDLESREWAPVAGPHVRGTASDALVGQGWGTRACLGYDPELRAHLAVETATLSGVWIWRGRSWARYASMPPSNWRTPYSAYMPDRREYFVWNGHGWWIFKPRGKQWTSVPAPAGAEMYSFDYDTINRVIIGASYGDGGFRMWMVRPEAGAWTELPVTTPFPPQRGGRDAAQLLRYDPLHNVFLFIVYRAGGGGTSHSTELWAWRYKKAVPTQ